MTKIFVDSNYFIALFNPQDSLFKQATLANSKLEKDNPQIYISTYIFSEIVTVLSQRTGRVNAIHAGNQLLEGRISILQSTMETEELSWKIFNRVKKKNMSFVDCSSIAVMQAEGINKFLTFDEEDFSPLRKKYSFSFY